MVKKRLIEDIKINPSRFYRVPGDVIRDRRFRDGERLEILEAWQSEAASAPSQDMSALLQQVMDAKKELESRNDVAVQNS